MEATIEAPAKATIEAPALPILPADELEKISATDAGLKQLLDRAASYGTLAPITDKDTYDEIHKFTMVTVKVRTESKKLAERLAEPHKLKAKQIIEEGLRIGAEAQKAEDLVRPLKEGYEAEQARLKEEKAKADAARIQNRTQTVINLGMTYRGTGYHLGEHVIDNVDIKAAPDDKFAALLAPVEAYAAELLEQQRIERENAEIERQRKEKELEDERKRLNAERQAQQEETRRLAEQQADLRRQQQALADQQRLLNAERLAQQQEQERAEAEARRIEQEKADTVAAEKEAAQREKDQKAKEAADKKAIADQKKADKERQIRLKSDKFLLQDYLHCLSSTSPRGKLTQPESDSFMSDIAKDLEVFLSQYQDKLNNL